MYETLVARTRSLPRGQRVVVIAAMIAASAVLGQLSGNITPGNSALAAWSPAIGVGVCAVLFAYRRLLVAALIVASVFLTGITVGHQSPALSLVGGATSGVGSFIVAKGLTLRHNTPHLSVRADVARLLGASIVGAVAASVLGAIGTWLASGANPLTVLSPVATSYFTATLLIVPLVLVGFRVERFGAIELAIQVAVLSVGLSGAFWPGQTLPLAFVPLPILLWAAIRLPFFVVVIEVVLSACTAVALTVHGGGPFAYIVGHAPALTIALLQFYLVMLCVSVLLLGVLRSEREALLNRAQAAETSLRIGLSQAQVGLILLEANADRLHVREMNSAATQMLHLDPDPDITDLERVAQGRLRSHITATLETMSAERVEQWTGEWDDGEAQHLQLHIAAVPATIEPRSYTVQLVDTTVHHKTERALAAALANEQTTGEVLRQLAQQQDEFVASVTHDLRTPLANVMGFAEELEMTQLTDEQQTYLRVISRNTARLLVMVNNLLKLSEFTHHAAPQRAEPVPICAIISECVEDLSTAAAAKNVTLLGTSAGVDTATPYPFEITQILTNLAANAIKFTPEGGTVTLSASCSADFLNLAVVDTGIGIPPERLSHVMEPFSRSGAAAGTGLGLAVVKGLADSLGGTFALESDGITGTKARICLPLGMICRPSPSNNP
jgi:two-component system phosphate regulon sensor histidine kinase PhoR